MARALIIAYTTYIHDGRVKRHAEALAERGDHVDVICLDQAGVLNRVNIRGLGIRRFLQPAMHLFPETAAHCQEFPARAWLPAEPVRWPATRRSAAPIDC